MVKWKYSQLEDEVKEEDEMVQACNYTGAPNYYFYK